MGCVRAAGTLVQRLLLAMALLVGGGVGFSGVAVAGWSQLTSGSVNNLKSLHFVNANVGYAVGESGTILKTINGGTNWISQSIGGVALNSVSVAPAGSSYEKFLAYTENDPANIVTINRYSTVTNGTHPNNTNTIVYRDYGAGYFDDAVGYTHLFEFVHGSNTKSYNVPWAVSNGVSGFFSVNSGYMLATDGTDNGPNAGKLSSVWLYNNSAGTNTSAAIATTYTDQTLYGKAVVTSTTVTVTLYSDAARTAQILTLSRPSSNLSFRYIYGYQKRDADIESSTYSVSNMDIQDQTAYIARNGGSVMRTTSGGAAWGADTAAAVNLNGVYFVTPQVGWSVGVNETILKTTDGGGVWTTQRSGTATLNGLFFIDANSGYAVGDGGLILKTVDGGSSWTPQTVGGSNLLSVHFPTSAVGYAVGQSGVILKTINGGSSWVPQQYGGSNWTSVQLTSVNFNDANRGWAVGAGGAIINTTDGGTIWSPQASPVAGISFTGVQFVSATTGYIVGSGGGILKTTDGGGGLTFPIVKQAWIAGGATPLVSPVLAGKGSTVIFLIYVKNPTPSLVADLRMSDLLDETAFEYVANSLVRTSAASPPTDTDTDLVIFNASAAGTGTAMSDVVDGDVISAQDTGGIAGVDKITIGAVVGQANAALAVRWQSTFAFRFNVKIK